MKTLLLSLFTILVPLLLSASKPVLGADRMELLLPQINGKRVALVVNHTSLLSNGEHLSDALLARQVSIVKIFAPEHGFRGIADAGELVKHGKDERTGIPVVSLYGSNKKPSDEQLSNVDVVIFDIQDVGARFYTYISTMYHVMDACAQSGKKIIVLDRPNPCDYVDGPLLEKEFISFVGIVPIPLLHGLTIGELAQMMVGEKWLKSDTKCNLSIVPILGWKHKHPYSLPVKPSPNLPNDQSIALYPSLCLFEATNISVGRGTTYPFQVLGSPDKRFGSFTFMPKSLEGFDKNPKYKDQICYGIDLRSVVAPNGFSLRYLMDFCRKGGGIDKVVTSRQSFNRLAGTAKLYEQIEKGMSEAEIRETWKPDLTRYHSLRKRYLLYEE